MAVCDGAGRAGTAIGLLITQRSEVQSLPPLLISAGQRPFPGTERAFCVTGNVTRGGAGAGCRGLTGETGWHAARQRETRKTTPPAISGRFLPEVGQDPSFLPCAFPAVKARRQLRKG